MQETRIPPLDREDALEEEMAIHSSILAWEIPWTVACKALFMEFPMQEYWSGLPFPFQGDLPDPGIEPMSLALAGRFLLLSQQGIPFMKNSQ